MDEPWKLYAAWNKSEKEYCMIETEQNPEGALLN